MINPQVPQHVHEFVLRGVTCLEQGQHNVDSMAALPVVHTPVEAVEPERMHPIVPESIECVGRN